MEAFVESNGVKIWTDARGQNKKGSVLLCNGGPGCCDYLRPVSEMLEDAYRVIRFEQRGCGRSQADGRYDIDTALMDLEAIRRYYQIDKWVVGGHSWGANLALFYALAHSDRTTAVLYMAGNGLQRSREWSAAYHANRDKFGEEMPEMPYPGNDAVNRAGNADYQKRIESPTLFRDIARLPMDILFLCAELDVRPNWPAEQLCCLAPKGRLALIPNAAHYLWLRQPQAVRTQLRRFLGLQ